MSHLKIELIKDCFSEQRAFIEGEIILTLSGVIHFSSITVDLVLSIKLDDIHVAKRLARIELLDFVAEFRPGVSRLCFKLNLKETSHLPPTVSYSGFETSYELYVEAITNSPLAFSLKEIQPVKCIQDFKLELQRHLIAKDITDTNLMLCCSKGVTLNFQAEALFSSFDGLNIKITTCESILNTSYIALNYRIYGDLCYGDHIVKTLSIWEDSKPLLLNFLAFDVQIPLDMFPFDYVVDGAHITYIIKLEIQYISKNLCIKNLKETVYL